MSSAADAPTPLADYYRWHARIYDLTRWAFLFGRQRLIRQAAETAAPARVLEIGCGTGKNLVALAEAFPAAQIAGLDLSADMLDRARPKLEPFGSRVSLLHRSYDAPVSVGEKFDLILFSYSLSMMNPGYDSVLSICQSDLSERGAVAVVDFHHSPWSWFRRWMGVNHVRMEGQILSRLLGDFRPAHCQVHRAYAGFWRYLVFIGQLKTSA